MDSATDSSAISTPAGALGYWLGGFFIPMVVAYILLRFAGSPKRKPGIATTLRVFAILAAALLAYAEYIGGGGQINPGALLAIAVTIAWALKQQFGRKTV